MISRRTFQGEYPLKPLGDVVDFLDSQREPITASKRVPGPYPYYGANGQQDSVADFIFDEPLILLAEDGGLFDEPDRGIAYAISGKTWVNNHAHVLRAKDGVNRNFLLRVLENYDVRPWLTGSTRAKLTKAGASQILIPLPHPDEQKRIASILDTADAVRRKRAESLETLDELAPSLFHELFGDPVTPNPVGKIATNAKHVGRLARIQTGKLDANAADDDGMYPFFTCAKEESRINAFAFDTKAVIVAGNGDLNVKYYEGKFNAYQRTYVIESLNEKELLPIFLYAYMDQYVAELRKQAIGGVIKYIKKPYLTEAKIMLPSPDEQKEFASMIETIEAQKTRLRAHLDEAEALFASLQHRAFAGEL